MDSSSSFRSINRSRCILAHSISQENHENNPYTTTTHMTWVANARCWYHDNLLEAAILQARKSHDKERRLTSHSNVRPLEKSYQGPCTKASCLSLGVSNTQLTIARFNSCKSLELPAVLLSSSPHKENTNVSQIELAQPTASALPGEHPL